MPIILVCDIGMNKVSLWEEKRVNEKKMMKVEVAEQAMREREVREVIEKEIGISRWV